MDKASIIKDAIEYIQHLHEQEKSIEAEITELESGKQIMNKTPTNIYFQQDLPLLLRSKKKKTEHLQLYDSVLTSRNSPIELLEVIN